MFRFLAIGLIRVQMAKSCHSGTFVPVMAQLHHQSLMHFTPLIFENLDYTWSFSAELSPEGLIGIVGGVLRYVCTR
jgi:hypothetical protein